MGQRAVLSMALCGFAAAVMLPATAQAQVQDRVSTSEKGSLVIWPKVELRWNSDGQLIQDTILSLTNDRNTGVNVKMYFVQGDPELDEGSCTHLGWNKRDWQGFVTQNQAFAWSLASGQSYGTGNIPQPGNFTQLDTCGTGTEVGRPDPDGGNERVLRGFVVCWAVNANGEEINHNHLKGEALILNYGNGTAWEYSSYNHQAIVGNEGDTLDDGVDDPIAGELEIGTEYSPAYSSLLLNFIATGSDALRIANATVDQVDTDLTLLPMDMDLRQDGIPTRTKATITIWNSNEDQRTGLDRCVICWDEALVGNYAPPNSFLLQNLGTDFGKARIVDTISNLCHFDADPDDGLEVGDGVGDVLSVESALVGVAVRQMRITYTGQSPSEARAGTHLIGTGFQNAVIYGDVGGDSDSLTDIPETPEQITNWIDRQVRKGMNR